MSTANENKSLLARILTGRSSREAKDTGMAACLICLFLAWWSGWQAWLLAGMAVLLVAMVLPDLYRPLAFLWFGLAEILGAVVGRLLLGLLFVIWVLPVGLLRSAFGADSLRLKEFGKGKDSVFKDRAEENVGDMERPF